MYQLSLPSPKINLKTTQLQVIIVAVQAHPQKKQILVS